MSKTQFELAIFHSTAECAEVRRDAFNIQTLPPLRTSASSAEPSSADDSSRR